MSALSSKSPDDAASASSMPSASPSMDSPRPTPRSDHQIRGVSNYLSAAERQRDHLLRLLRERHAPLLRPRALAALEAAEAPRYALFEVDRPRVRLFLDPAQAEEVEAAALRRRLLQAERAPGAVHAPALCPFAEAGPLELLRARGL